MRLLSPKRGLQVCFVIAVALGSLLLYRARTSPTFVPFAKNDESQPSRVPGPLQPFAKSPVALSESETASTAISGKTQRRPDATMLATSRGQDRRLRDARAKLRKIQAELAEASDEAEVVRLQRNQRVMSRLVEHMQQQGGVSPPGV
jgi:hypothetical protein